MKDVMLDFETLGNGTNKCICQIGLVYFDNQTGELGESLKINIDAASHEAYGGRLNASTVYWWLEQSEAARASLLSNRKPILEAMIEVNEFISKASRIWSHATFDFVTLIETFKQLEIKPTVSYKTGLDIRTLVYLSGISTSSIVRTGTHHDALADCKYQVKYCVAALNLLKSNKRVISMLSKMTE